MGFSRLAYHAFSYQHSLQNESTFNMFKSKRAKLLLQEGFTQRHICEDIIISFTIFFLHYLLRIRHFSSTSWIKHWHYTKFNNNSKSSFVHHIFTCRHWFFILIHPSKFVVNSILELMLWQVSNLPMCCPVLQKNHC